MQDLGGAQPNPAAQQGRRRQAEEDKPERRQAETGPAHGVALGAVAASSARRSATAASADCGMPQP